MEIKYNNNKTKKINALNNENFIKLATLDAKVSLDLKCLISLKFILSIPYYINNK